MVKPKRAKLTQTSTENATKEDDPESSTQATAKEQPVSKPNASTQPVETNPVGIRELHEAFVEAINQLGSSIFV
ncbi:hypothetical protein F2Q69_00043374 [Brassica cretica]|uniref:Uncharacterized protein n=1 Tax=Brassica cretica TaxID=69181 RepID=A0A8S9NHX7_BRACR|nr:hypothetical protein F2Q69_00043374 [Brassica cretica]